jgi:hypothetical protein
MPQRFIHGRAEEAERHVVLDLSDDSFGAAAESPSRPSWKVGGRANLPRAEGPIAGGCRRPSPVARTASDS